MHPWRQEKQQENGVHENGYKILRAEQELRWYL